MFPVLLQAEILKIPRMGGFGAGWWLQGPLIEFCRWGAAARNRKGTAYVSKREGRWPTGLSFLQHTGRKTLGSMHARLVWWPKWISFPQCVGRLKTG